jgi:hypothetical protein
VDQKTYHNAVAAARSIYDLMIRTAGGPATVRVKDLAQHSDPLIKSAARYITGGYLNWENMRTAALAGDFAMIHVGYARNEHVVASRAEHNPGRRAFIAWAVAQIRERRPQRLTQTDLLGIWESCPRSSDPKKTE